MYLAVVNFYLEKGYKLDVLNNSIFERTSDYCIYIKVKEFDERFRYTFEIRFIDSKEKALRIAKQFKPGNEYKIELKEFNDFIIERNDVLVTGTITS